MRICTVSARPYPFELNLATCALLVIDMQRDFLEPGGFGEALGNDVSRLRSAIAPISSLLAAWRSEGALVIHTREGHSPDLSDLPAAKFRRSPQGPRIGDLGPMGRILIRGQHGHDLIPELAPRPGEPVIDKPGKGAFWSTNLGEVLTARKITQLVVVGVTTEVCVHTTVREANDRGFDCLVPEDAVASYFPEFHRSALAMIEAQGGIFGWVTHSETILKAINPRS